MARKKKIKIPFHILKYPLFILLILGVSFLIYKGLSNLVVGADYFRIKSVQYDSSLQFIDRADIGRLKGTSIFEVDIKEVQKRLQRKYPQASDLRVLRKFPNHILIKAKKRLPSAQIKFKNTIFTIDETGLIVSTSSKMIKKLPLITGIRTVLDHKRLGDQLLERDIHSALDVIEIFQKNVSLSSQYEILSIDVNNLSKITMMLSNNLNVIIDLDKISYKMKTLSVVLTQGQLKLEEIKYLDLRFKEPIIGKK